MAREKKKPERIFRIGDVSASIFLQETDDDRRFHTVNLQRSYKLNGKRQYGGSMTLADLPAAIEVLRLAMAYVGQEQGEALTYEGDSEVEE